MIKVRVPATSANLGPGFDCMGVALGLYNYIEVLETDSGGVQIESHGIRHGPAETKRNLVYKAMQKVFESLEYKPRGLIIRLSGDIPATRGLGSSAACVVGGAVAANALCGNKMDTDDIIRLTSHLEGHPDNAVPCLLGGFAVSVKRGERVRYVRSELMEKIKFALFIPDFKLKTKKSKAALPIRILHKDAVFNAGNSALLAASLMSGKLENLEFAMDDRLHQRFRRHLVPGMNQIFKAARTRGAKGVYLSGAGPTVAAVIDEDYESFAAKMKEYLSSQNHLWQVKILAPDNTGAVIEASN